MLVYLTHIFSSLQDSFDLSIERISELHDWALVVLLWVVSIVLYLLIFISNTSGPYSKFSSSEWLEAVWTCVPMVVLFALSLFSLRVLYILEDIETPDVTVKVTGHQWYWTYDCGKFTNSGFDSYLVGSSDLSLSGFRLLEVDSPLPLPVGLEVRLLITSEDVIHSWAVPSLGLNMDGIPGRLNQVVVSPYRAGVLYGQCSEMCGAYHSFMPINVECFSC